MRVTFVAVLLAALLAVSSVEAGVRFAQQRYAGSRHVRHGNAAVLAEREFEAQGHYGAEQAVVLNEEEQEDEAEDRPGLVETYATADRGQRSAVKAERSLSGPSAAMHYANQLTNHFAAPELEPVHEQAATPSFAVPPVFREAASLPPPPDSVDISMVDLDAGVYPTPAMLAMRQHAAAQVQAQAPQPAPQPLFQRAAQPAPSMVETAAKFVVPASASLHNHMHVFQGPPSALAPAAATYAPAAAAYPPAAAASPFGPQGGALPRFSAQGALGGALGGMPFGYPPSPPQFGAVPSGVGASNFQATFPAPPALQLSADPYTDFARMQAYAAQQNVVSGAPRMPELPPPPVGIF